MSAPNGGPAFPVTFQHRYPDGKIVTQDHEGMSLRDWFAGQYLGGQSVSDEHDAKVHAHRAYLAADAMLAERKT